MLYPCEIIAEQLAHLFDCITINGYVRIRTPLLYPDGDIIDIYFREDKGNILLTDLGSTLQWLNTQTAIEKRTKRQMQMIQDICATHNIRFSDGTLYLQTVERTQLARAVTMLAEAAVRVADIYFTFSARPGSAVVDEVAEFLTERDVPFRPNEKVRGYSGKEYTIDFFTFPKKRDSYVTLLSTGSRSTALELAEKTLGIWRDLDILKQASIETKSPVQFVTLFDDTQDVWQPEHERMLQRDSKIAHWSDAAEFLRKLEAA